jgi:hypothetical protein
LRDLFGLSNYFPKFAKDKLVTIERSFSMNIYLYLFINWPCVYFFYNFAYTANTIRPIPEISLVHFILKNKFQNLLDKMNKKLYGYKLYSSNRFYTILPIASDYYFWAVEGRWLEFKYDFY